MDVKSKGNQALTDYTLEFDKQKITSFTIESEAFERAEKSISSDLKKAIQLAKKNIESFHRAQKTDIVSVETQSGVECWQEKRPIEKVGLYIPGGSAPLFSTILMLAIPAKIAGCKEIVLCTPPNETGKVSDVILYTAYLCGVTQIFRVGGIQAIAAMTFGTETIPKVFKIFGPGNQFVTVAKQMATQHHVAIDMPAGPSELLVVADQSANPVYVASDLLSQAEHGADSQVILITTYYPILEKVSGEIKKQLPLLPRKEIAMQAIENSKMIAFDSNEDAIAFINQYDNIDKVIALIRSSSNADEAREKLIKNFKLTEIQAKAIVEMRLRQLTGLEQDKLRAEFEALMKTIKDLKDILDKKERRMQIIIDELLVIKDKYGDERRSVIEFAGGNFSIEDMIPDEKVVITISHAGYIKRTPLSEYKTQNRGGVGQKASTTRNEDFLEHLFVGTNHQYMLFFTQKGKCFWMRVYEIPEGSKIAKGRAIQNLINIEQDDKVKAFINTQDLKDEDYINNHYVIMATKKGQVKKTLLEQYSRPRANGINAITIKDDDELLEAKLTTGNSQILLAVKSGKAIRFEENKTRPMGRNASGVRGITLNGPTDEVIGMVSVSDPETEILVVSENGYGKRSSLEDYRTTNRGGKGVKTLSITDKTGSLVSIKNVSDLDDLMIINKSGIAIRMDVANLRVMGRATQGVKLINLKGSDTIAAVAKVMKDEEEISDNTEELPTPENDGTNIE